MDEDALKSLADRARQLKEVRQQHTAGIKEALSPVELATALIVYRVYDAKSPLKVSIR